MNTSRAYASAILISLLSLVLFCCSQSPPATETATAPTAPIDTTAQPLVPPPAPPADTTDWMAYRAFATGPADTTLLIDGQRYRLLVTAEPDSSHPLLATYKHVATIDSFRGVDARFQFVLRNAAGRTLFQKQFHKPAFYQVVAKDIVVESKARLPQFVAYSPALQSFLFTLDFMVPDSDVGGQCAMLLSLDGKVRDLTSSNYFGGGEADCTPRLSPNGQAALTCSRLLCSGQKPFSLLKPKSNLVLAHFISDTTLLTIYAYGENHYEYGADSSIQSMQFVEPPRMRAVPNAFVLNLRGKPLGSFRYDGYTEELGYSVPRHYLPQNHTYYLLHENRGLRLINKRNPAATREVRFQQMTRFKPPQKPREVRFQIQGMEDNLEFYADQDHPEQLRYRKVAAQ